MMTDTLKTTLYVGRNMLLGIELAILGGIFTSRDVAKNF